MADSTSWPTIKLGDVATFRNGINFNKDSFGTGIKVLGVSDFQDYLKPHYEELDQINPKGIVSERNILKDGDIVFVRSNGNRELIGRSLFIQNPPEEITHSAFTIRLRFNSPDVFPRFYAYCFRTQIIRKSLTAYGGGTNISNLNQDILSALEVPMPPLETQQKLTGILNAYDELIENNQRRIRILEEMARRLYREWFVHFRFPGHENHPRVPSPLGEIPQGWTATKFGNIAEEARRNVPKGTLEQKVPYIGLEHIPRRSLALDAWEMSNELGSNKLGFKRGEILFGKIRPYFHKVVAAPFDGVCSADTIVIRPLERKFTGLVTAFASSDQFVALVSASANGSKMPRANWDVMSEAKLALPPDDLLNKFSEVITSAVTLMQSLVVKNINLRRTRDLLLPRLLSGQIHLEAN